MTAKRQEQRRHRHPEGDIVDLALALARESRRTAGAVAGALADTGRHLTIGLAGQLWHGVTSQIDLRITRLLNSLQIPTHRDVEELSKRVERLSRQVDRLSKPARPKPAASRQRRRRGAGSKAS